MGTNYSETRLFPIVLSYEATAESSRLLHHIQDDSVILSNLYKKQGWLVAHQLWVTEGTVEKHVRSILSKLNLHEEQDDHRRVLALLTYLEAR